MWNGVMSVYEVSVKGCMKFKLMPNIIANSTPVIEESARDMRLGRIT